MMPGENWTPRAAGDELLGRDPGAPPENRRLEAQARRKQHTKENSQRA
jgi:hypothetical protein